MPQHLDAPMRIVIWTMDEFFLLAVPFVTGLLVFNQPLVGLVLGLLSSLLLKKLKGDKGIAAIYHAVYWVLPPVTRLKVIPPSYQRCFSG